MTTPEKKLTDAVKSSSEKLKARFEAFEKRLQTEIEQYSENIAVADLNLRESIYRRIERPSSGVVERENAESGAEATQLRRALDREKNEKQELQRLVAQLQESIRAMGQEHQSLRESVSGEKTNSESSQSRDYENLTRQLNVYRAHRQHTAQMLRKWLRVFRKQKKMLQESNKKNMDYKAQIKKLTEELDIALEQTAELKDEARMMNRTESNPAPKPPEPAA